MFKKALDYTGKYRKTSYAAIAFMLVGVTMTVIPYFIAYQLIVSLLGYGELTSVGVILRITAIAVCGVLYAVLYVHGLSLSHVSAYNTLKNIRVSLQKKAGGAAAGNHTKQRNRHAEKGIYRRYRNHRIASGSCNSGRTV
nr:hypothetical protein [Ruminococcus sp.]